MLKKRGRSLRSPFFYLKEKCHASISLTPSGSAWFLNMKVLILVISYGDLKNSLLNQSINEIILCF